MIGGDRKVLNLKIVDIKKIERKKWRN